MGATEQLPERRYQAALSRLRGETTTQINGAELASGIWPF
jgi:hypothetical protein